MNFWEFYAAHPVLGTLSLGAALVALLLVLLAVESIAGDAIKALAVARGAHKSTEDR